MASNPSQTLPIATTFPLFSRLAPELQCLIWEHTWPAARVIEAASFENPQYDSDDEEEEEEEGEDDEEEEAENEQDEEVEDEEIENEEADEEEMENETPAVANPYEVTNLQLAGYLSTMISDEDIGCRIVENRPVEKCDPPVALQICALSRTHTLRHYRVMDSLAGNFYFSPSRDVISFSVDVADDYPVHFPMLETYHHVELNLIQNVLVVDSEWPEVPRGRNDRGPGNYMLDCLSHLGGLRTVMVLWREREQGQGVLQGVATGLRTAFPGIIRNERCTASRLELLDVDGNVY